MTTRRFPGSYLALLLALVVFQAGGAQETPTASTHRHSLWKLSGQQATVYLLGSVHFLKADNYPLAAPIEAAFSHSAAVVFETDIGLMEDPKTQQQTMTKAMLAPGETFQEQLSPQTYGLFTNHAAEVGLPMFVFEQFKPAMAAITLEMLQLQKLGFKPEHGVDMHFYKLARQQEKTITRSRRLISSSTC
jgi:uncharacterized protein YbaP (TraB family)